MVKDLGWKKGDLEVRTTTGVRGEPYVELIKWEKTDSGRRTCITLAYFHKNRDGYVELHFVGDRPFKEIAEIDINECWKELWLTQMMLEERE
jgi:hypothetical protein